MSTTTVISPIESCKVMQSYLAVRNQPGTGELRFGAQAALIDPFNRTGLVDVRISGSGVPVAGSGCKLILKYIKEDCTDVTHNLTLCGASPVAEGNPFGNAEFQFETADIISKDWTLSEEDFLCSCDPMDRQVAEIGNQKLRTIFKAAERRTLDTMYNCLGDYCDGVESTVTPRTFNIFNADGNAAQPLGWWGVAEQMKAMGKEGPYYIVGGKAIEKYIWAQSHAGLGAQAIGANMLVTDTYKMFYSSEFDGWAASKGHSGNFAIAFAPGVFQLIDWQRNVGPTNVQALETKVRSRMSYFNEGHQYFFDNTLFKDLECDLWKVLYTRTSGVFCMPASDCDGTVGNGRFLIELGCGAVDCGPACASAGA